MEGQRFLVLSWKDGLGGGLFEVKTKIIGYFVKNPHFFVFRRQLVQLTTELIVVSSEGEDLVVQQLLFSLLFIKQVDDLHSLSTIV